jgi:hypothetical protein
MLNFLFIYFDLYSLFRGLKLNQVNTNSLCHFLGNNRGGYSFEPVLNLGYVLE